MKLSRAIKNSNTNSNTKKLLKAGIASIALVISSPALAQPVSFDIDPQPLAAALKAFSLASGREILFSSDIIRSKRTSGIEGSYEPGDALQKLLQGTGLRYTVTSSNTFLVQAAPEVPQRKKQSFENEDDSGNVIIVTAQKREERIQDVPIAMTALSADALDDRKIEGGSELLRAIPNVNFSKTNFSMYNFQIRGVGTQSISASSDAAVAVSFNNTPLVRNRLFESEFFDM